MLQATFLSWHLSLALWNLLRLNTWAAWLEGIDCDTLGTGGSDECQRPESSSVDALAQTYFYLYNLRLLTVTSHQNGVSFSNTLGCLWVGGWVTDPPLLLKGTLLMHIDLKYQAGCVQCLHFFFYRLWITLMKFHDQALILNLIRTTQGDNKKWRVSCN